MASRSAELTVVVTRAVHQAGALSDLLRQKGARVIELPTIAIAEPEDQSLFDRAMGSIDRYDAVLIGSKNAADAVKRRGFVVPIPVCAVGKKTKQQLAAMSDVFTGEIFAAELQRAEGMVEALERKFMPIQNKRFLFLRAPEGRETAIDLLEERGAIVDAIAAYRIVAAPPASAAALAELERADVFTFLSGETLACFFEVVPNGKELLERKRVAVIGPIAQERAYELNVRVDVMPAEPTVEALVAVLTES